MTNNEFARATDWLDENIEKYYQAKTKDESDKYDRLLADKFSQLYDMELDPRRERIIERLEDEYMEIWSYRQHNPHTLII